MPFQTVESYCMFYFTIVFFITGSVHLSTPSIFNDPIAILDITKHYTVFFLKEPRFVFPGHQKAQLTERESLHSDPREHHAQQPTSSISLSELGNKKRKKKDQALSGELMISGLHGKHKHVNSSNARGLKWVYFKIFWKEKACSKKQLRIHSGLTCK